MVLVMEAIKFRNGRNERVWRRIVPVNGQGPERLRVVLDKARTRFTAGSPAALRWKLAPATGAEAVRAQQLYVKLK